MSIFPSPIAETVMHPDEERLARRYAEAFIEAAGDSLPDAREALSTCATLLEETSGAMWMLIDPSLSSDSREQIVSRTFEGRCMPVVTGLLRTLARHSRLSILTPVLRQLDVVLGLHSGKVEVILRTAVPLAGDTRDELTQTLSQLCTGPPTLREQVDPSLLGGLIVQVGDTVYDGSIRGRLSDLADKMTTTNE